MHIVLLCATNRGYLFFDKLTSLIPDGKFTVISFRETQWEPPYFDRICSLVKERGGNFIEARAVNSEKLKSFWEHESIDIMFLVNWRYLIRSNIYKKPRLGTYVFHDSLLPKYRGFSPTVWAIINGEDHTGVTLFQIADDVDFGDIVDQKKTPIGKDDTIAQVMERVTQDYLGILESNLKNLLSGSVSKIAQDHSFATFTCRRLPEDNVVDWKLPTIDIYNLIRAVSKPYPGAYTYLDGKKLFLWKAQLLNEVKNYVGIIPGRVLQVIPGKGTVVQTIDGHILLTEVEPENGECVCASEILNSLNQTLGK